MNDLMKDRLIAAVGDVYEIEHELGRGGMAIVYRARDVRLRRRVAIKLLPPELGFRPDVRQRFLREAETAAQLNHPHIVPIYQVDERDGLVFFVMALVEGETLGELLARAPRPPIRVVCRVLSEVADALHYAHSRGVVHRDIKPDNILIERDTGRALVTDFGIARAAEAESRLTVTGVAVGTPAYMSPEQALGEHELDGRSDLYSLAIVGYEMLAGELPFRAANTPAMMMKHVGEPPRPVRERRLDCPPALARAIDVALAKKREQRWNDAAAFRAALEDVQTPAPVAAVQEVPAVPRPAIQPLPYRVAEPSRAPGDRPAARERPEPYERSVAWGGTRDARMSRFAMLPLDERIRIFRRDAVNGACTIGFLSFINFMFTPFFPWVVFAGIGIVSRLWRRFEYLERDGIALRDVLSRRWRERLQQRGKLLPPVGDRAPAPPESATRSANARAERERLVPPEVLSGPYGGAVSRAVEDRVVILETLRQLAEADRASIPDVEPTAATLVQRVAELATSLQRMDSDVSADALARLEARIAAARTEAGESKERERRLALLERQRATLKDLKERRDMLFSQLESASLLLQNLRLDLLKLRSAGIDAASSGLNSATQEARALSRDIGHVLEAADEVRRL